MENEEIIRFYHHGFQSPIATTKGCLGIIEMLINEMEMDINEAKEKNNLTLTQKERLNRMEIRMHELLVWKELAVKELEKVSQLARQKMNIVV